MLVFLTVLIYGFYKNGLKFLKHLRPPRRSDLHPAAVVLFIEVISFFLRPVSLSVRLFANMLAGHITLKVFAGFVAMLGFSLGALGWLRRRAAARA
jgi:F-type H+-transporting ATPase subunit a